MANDVGLKALTQVSGSTDIMFTDRRNFYLDEQYTAELWSDVTPFLNFSASVNTIRGLKDPDFLM